MNIILSNASPDPIYEQICKQIKHLIVTGELPSGELLPSIRNLARELQISVITSKRAYEELEREGYIESVSGKGTFVAAQDHELLREKRMRLIEDKLMDVIADSKVMAITVSELHQMLDLLYGEG